MVSAGDFRNGITVEIEGNVFQIIEFQHVKPGKGAAFVRTKLKNIKSGGVVEKTFRPTEKFENAHIERVDMQYLYSDGDLFYFMDVNTYEQIPLSKDMIGDALKFVKENEMVKVCSHKGQVFSIEPPLFVELEINEQRRLNGEHLCSLSRLCSLSWRSRRRSLASREIRPPVRQSPPLWRQVQLFMSPCLWIREIRSKSTPGPVSICREHRDRGTHGNSDVYGE